MKWLWLAFAAGIHSATFAQVEATDTPVAKAQIEPASTKKIVEEPSKFIKVADEFLPAYLAVRPSQFLIDPQNLLDSSTFQERLEFLNYHAGDSSIDLFVYVIGGDQQIPSEIHHQDWLLRFFSTGRPAVVVDYYLGAPQRSVFSLSPTITEAISIAERNRALESSIMQALAKTKPSEQLESFLAQMSIRIYWMERMLAGEAAARDVRPVLSVENRLSAAKLAKSEKSHRLKSLAIQFSPFVALLVFISLVAFIFLRRMKIRARYHFPLFDVEPRLGGANGAGVGAVISFANATISPASQRDQVPDSLHR